MRLARYGGRLRRGYPWGVFGRRTQSTATPATDALVEEPTGKGRPTPKRREAEKARKQRVAAPTNRKEAARLARERQREARLKARQGMQSGDERYLPARDRGPVRRFARDFVDSRRSVAEYFLLLALAVLVLTWVQTAVVARIVSSVWIVMLLVIVADSYVLNRKLKKELRARFPDADTKGVSFYAIMRSMQLRKLRMPAPQVKPGAHI
jgi:hypothetical protein